MTKIHSKFAAILGVVLFSLFAQNVKSQNVTIDTAFGGQLYAVLQGKIIVQPNDTVQISTEWDYKSTFSRKYVSFVKTVTNDSVGGADTLHLQDTIWFSASGQYFVRYLTATDSTGGIPVLVSKVWVAPTLKLGKAYPTSDGGVQPINYDCGNTTATLEVWESPGDSTLKYPYRTQTVSLNGVGTMNIVFDGKPSQSLFSFQFRLKNSVDSVTSGVKYLTVLPSAGPAWTSNIDTVNTTQDSIHAQTEVITNGDTTRVVMYLKKHLSKNFTDSVVTIIAGQGGVNSVWSRIGNLKASTDYDICVCAMNKLGGKCSDTIAVSTLSIPLTLSVVVDTLYPINGTTEHVILKVTSPDSAWVGAQLTTMSDLKFNNPIASPNLRKVGPGITFLGFDFTGRYVGEKLRTAGYAFDFTSTHIVPVDSGVPFVFGIPTPRIVYMFASKPKIKSAESVSIWFKSDNADEAEIVDQNTFTITSLNATDSAVFTPTITTTYILYAYNYQFGGVDTQSITIEVVQPKAKIISFTTSKDTVIAGGSAKLSWSTDFTINVDLSTFGSVPANGYQIVSPTVTTTYLLTATDINGVTDTMSITVIVLYPTGIDEPIIELLNKTYPNPSTGSTTITIPAGKSSAVQIFDNSGMLIKTEQAHGGSTVIDTSGLKPGIYYFRTEFGQGTFVVS